MRRRKYWRRSELLKAKENNKILEKDEEVKKRATKSTVAESIQRKEGKLVGGQKNRAKLGIKPNVLSRIS